MTSLVKCWVNSKSVTKVALEVKIKSIQDELPFTKKSFRQSAMYASINGSSINS